MADFYEEMKMVAEELLAPTSAGGLGQGTIKLVKYTTSSTTNPWDVPTTVATEYALNGAARGVDSELIGVEVGGTVIQASDRVAICTVPTVAYSSGDDLSIDGKVVKIISVDNIPAAGITCAVRFIIRG